MEIFPPRRGKNDDQLREIVEYLLARLRSDNAPLQATVARIAQELRHIQTSLVGLEQRVDGQNEQLLPLAEHLTRLDHELGVVLQQNDELDARFTKVLAMQTTAGSAGASARHVEHHEIADRYRTFVDQELTSAARVVGAGRRQKPTVEGHAHDMGELSLAVFAGVEIDQRLLADLLKKEPSWATRLAVGATELRMLAAAALPVGTWSFDLHPRTALDPATQRPWGDYAPDTPLDFVVAPAYVVDNKVFEPQRVATERQRKR
jgi:hypothetical protein